MAKPSHLGLPWSGYSGSTLDEGQFDRPCEGIASQPSEYARWAGSTNCGSLRVAAYVWQPAALTHVNWVTRRLAGTRWGTRGVADRGAPTKGRGIHSEWANPSGPRRVGQPEWDL